MMINLCKFLKRFTAVKFLYNLMTGILLIFLFSFKKCRIVILTDCGPLIPLLVDLPKSSDVKAHSCLIFFKSVISCKWRCWVIAYPNHCLCECGF